MIYKQLKALAKICDQKAEPGQAVQSPVFGDDMCYATDTYVLVRVTGRSISELCKGLETPSQVPSVLIDGFSARQTVKVDDISVAVTKLITPKMVNDFVDMTGESAPVMVDPANLVRVMNVYKAFGIDPVIKTLVKHSNDFPYVTISGEAADYEIKACIVGKRKRY